MKTGREKLKDGYTEVKLESPNGYLEIPVRCPVSGGELYVSELTCEESGVTIRGKFRIPEQAALDEDKQAFLKVFLRARGVISTVEKEMGISYPTVRARLDGLLHELNLAPIKEDLAKKKRLDERKRQILKDLEDGKLSPEQAKKKVRGLK